MEITCKLIIIQNDNDIPDLQKGKYLTIKENGVRSIKIKIN